MTSTVLLSVPVDGTASLISVTFLAANPKMAAALGHADGSGRWVDYFEVLRYSDRRRAHDHTDLITRRCERVRTLTEALQLAREMHQEAAARFATYRWDEAEASLADHRSRYEHINQG